VAKEITRGAIQAKVDQLTEDGHISEAMKEAAHETRLVANEAAHCDLVGEPIKAEDAVGVVKLMTATIERVYEEPARVAQIRTNRHL